MGDREERIWGKGSSLREDTCGEKSRSRKGRRQMGGPAFLGHGHTEAGKRSSSCW